MTTIKDVNLLDLATQYSNKFDNYNITLTLLSEKTHESILLIDKAKSVLNKYQIVLTNKFHYPDANYETYFCADNTEATQILEYILQNPDVFIHDTIDVLDHPECIVKINPETNEVIDNYDVYDI